MCWRVFIFPFHEPSNCDHGEELGCPWWCCQLLAGVLPRMYSLSESLFVDDAGGDTGTAGKWNRFGCKIGRMPVPLQFPCLCWTSFTGFWPYSFCCKLRLFSGVARAASAAAAVFILTDYQVTAFCTFPWHRQRPWASSNLLGRDNRSHCLHKFLGLSFLFQ